MVPGWIFPLLLAAVVPALVALGVALHRARAGAAAERRRAEAAERLAVAHARCLGLAAAEIRVFGLCLLGHADRQRAAVLVPASDAAPIRATRPTTCGLRGQAEGLLRLADDLSDFAATGVSGPRRLNDVPLAFGPVLDEALATVESQAAPGHRHWCIDPALHRLSLRADARALAGILLALLQRVVRETCAGETVALRLVSSPATIAIVMEAAGAGLPTGDLGAQPTTITDRTRGLGLGLTVAHALARAHDGELVLESMPGVGMRTWFTLPRSRLIDDGAAAS